MAWRSPFLHGCTVKLHSYEDFIQRPVQKPDQGATQPSHPHADTETEETSANGSARLPALAALAASSGRYPFFPALSRQRRSTRPFSGCGIRQLWPALHQHQQQQQALNVPLLGLARHTTPLLGRTRHTKHHGLQHISADADSADNKQAEAHMAC
jgi:hypothetical protein